MSVPRLNTFHTARKGLDVWFHEKVDASPQVSWAEDYLASTSLEGKVQLLKRQDTEEGERMGRKDLEISEALPSWGLTWQMKSHLQKRKGSSSKHHFSGAMLNFGGVSQIWKSFRCQKLKMCFFVFGCLTGDVGMNSTQALYFVCSQSSKGHFWRKGWQKN